MKPTKPQQQAANYAADVLGVIAIREKRTSRGAI